MRNSVWKTYFTNVFYWFINEVQVFSVSISLRSIKHLTQVQRHGVFFSRLCCALLNMFRFQVYLYVLKYRTWRKRFDEGHKDNLCLFTFPCVIHGDQKVFGKAVKWHFRLYVINIWRTTALNLRKLRTRVFSRDVTADLPKTTTVEIIPKSYPISMPIL